MKKFLFIAPFGDDSDLITLMQNHNATRILFDTYLVKDNGAFAEMMMNEYLDKKWMIIRISDGDKPDVYVGKIENIDSYKALFDNFNLQQ